MQKQQIRNQVMALCRLMSEVERNKSEMATLKHLLPLLALADAIAIYHAHGPEFNLQCIIDYCLHHGKKLYQPVAYRHTRQMQLMPYDATVQKIFYPPEYIAAEHVEWYNMDLIILPMVAVDAFGNRLGKGGGYYDTTLEQLPQSGTKLCGIGYPCQIVMSKLPQGNFDVRLIYFVTENGLINFNGK